MAKTKTNLMLFAVKLLFIALLLVTVWCSKQIYDNIRFQQTVWDGCDYNCNYESTYLSNCTLICFNYYVSPRFQLSYINGQARIRESLAFTDNMADSTMDTTEWWNTSIVIDNETNILDNIYQDAI